MSDCIHWAYDAVAAKEDGKPLTATDIIIMRRSARLIHTTHQFSHRYGGVSFESTLRDDAKGCRFKHIHYARHPRRWVPIVKPMTDEQEDRAWKRALELDGRGYDLIGLASFATSLSIIKPHTGKYWCTEAEMELNVAAYGWDVIPHHFHPLSGYFEVLRRVGEMSA